MAEGEEKPVPGGLWTRLCAWNASVFQGAKLLRAVLMAAAILGVLSLLFVLGSYAAPLLTQRYQNARSDVARSLRGDPDRPGVSGLIYVESPEVYTRQRLVNDRYLQDAWLRERLEEIDDPDAGWIEEAQAEMRRAVLSIVAGREAVKPEDEAASESATSISDTALQELLKVPFDARFQLQSEARDKIRQLILENALDDRHDLSGNTVFGLKFDTSILPGSETYLNPTVAVRMHQNPLDRLFDLHRSGPDGTAVGPRGPEDFVRHFMRYEEVSGGDRQSPPWKFSSDELDILEQIDEYFAGWLLSLERRLAEYRGDVGDSCPDAESAAVRALLRAPICEADAGGGLRLSTPARARIETVLAQVESVDDALSFITRAPHFGRKTAEKLRAQVIRNAEDICGVFGDDKVTLEQFLSEQQSSIPSAQGRVPGVWGVFLDAKTTFRDSYKPGLCPFDIDMSFGGSSVTLFVTYQEGVQNFGPSADPSFLREGGLLPLVCEREFCPNFHVWLDAGPEADEAQIEEMKNSLSPEALATIGREAAAISERVVCRLQIGGSGPGRRVTGPDRETLLAQYKALVGDDGAGVEVTDCVAGRSLRLRLGAFEFFRRMAEVESYTYAAFPRGDVTGVVREVGEHQSLGLEGEASGASGRAGYERSSRERTIEAVPRVINFASGQSRSSQPELERSKHFDFGWTVVKEGAKEPMMVSQLVLISMPAYMDEISLTLWKGFLDLDKVPADRSALLPELEKALQDVAEAERVAGDAGYGDAAGDGPAPPARRFNDMGFEERIRFLMKGYETGTITLKVPPDFTALDSIVIGRSKILGPQINASALDQAVRPEQINGSHREECVRWSKIVEEAATDADKDEVYYHVEMVVPGERLWRSTVVTLGGAKAQRIEVMPDMRGILATFRLPEPPVAGEERIWVWTSEGRDTAVVRVCNSEGKFGPEPVAAASAP
ncbi:hypothetical protein AYJ57_20340 [Salipiger sp. CCB-MM3]|uniref:hypothetical protein n=1 Tax=Salipiger sp. CCB-MM3 TaxID=1792508 RepID=UPI00080AB1FF|nr:hypothetical protein [Salipiger sp. CCB-MM3]ANT62724.1 hypothetical protein AYJ57_20340 [Salipiger sp. CCB-MM3]